MCRAALLFGRTEKASAHPRLIGEWSWQGEIAVLAEDATCWRARRLEEKNVSWWHVGSEWMFGTVGGGSKLGSARTIGILARALGGIHPPSKVENPTNRWSCRLKCVSN
jgi:hypothetical protein